MKTDVYQSPLFFGAADEARTRYLHLGKVALYQMSYGRRMCILCEEYTRNDASDRNRTNDTGIFSPLLYRLSYRGKLKQSFNLICCKQQKNGDPERARTVDL